MIVLRASRGVVLAPGPRPGPSSQAHGRQANKAACDEPAAPWLGRLALDDLLPGVELLARRDRPRDEVDGGVRIAGRGRARARRRRRFDPALEEGEGFRSARRTLVLVVNLLAIQAEPCVV